MERWDRGDEPSRRTPDESTGGERGLHAPRQPGDPEPRRSAGPHNHRRYQGVTRWRRHEHTVPGLALEEWELVAFYESFEEPRA